MKVTKLLTKVNSILLNRNQGVSEINSFFKEFKVSTPTDYTVANNYWILTKLFKSLAKTDLEKYCNNAIEDCIKGTFSRQSIYCLLDGKCLQGNATEDISKYIYENQIDWCFQYVSSTGYTTITILLESDRLKVILHQENYKEDDGYYGDSVSHIGDAPLHMEEVLDLYTLKESLVN